MSTIGRSKNHTVVANGGANVGIGKINSEEACCLAGMSNPVFSAIGCGKNFSLEKADSRAVIFVAEVYGIKPVSRIGRLLIPVTATICCPQDYALLAYDGSNVGIDKVHTVEV